MRRLALSVIASCGIAIIAACAGPGTGFSGTPGNNTTVPDAIVFQNGSAGVNDFFVAPNGNAPLLISATGVRGAGVGTTIIPDLVFQWSAQYAPAGTTYVRTGSPNGNVTCGTPPVAATFPINSLLQQGNGGVAYGSPAYQGSNYTQLAFQPGSNPPNYTQQASQIFVGPPTSGGGPVQPTPATTGNYCMYITAIHGPSGRSGTVLVVVGNGP
ncbi:MAG: hypothetical protein GIW95_10435 [Candidatus Eremiobacteraeota bacterium]|nr:hypothetical protein [Candidatus Eremiobacteraeota bacterium]